MNIPFDILLKLKLPSVAWNILWYLVSMDDSNGEKNIAISLDNANERTGINKNSIIRALKLLSSMHIIRKDYGCVSFESVDSWLLESNNIKSNNTENTKNIQNIPKTQNIECDGMNHACVGDRFQEFLNSYPPQRRLKVMDSMKYWNELNPNDELVDKILESIELNRKSEAWTKEDGKYIPSCYTFLTGHRWLDNIEIKKDWRET